LVPIRRASKNNNDNQYNQPLHGVTPFLLVFLILSNNQQFLTPTAVLAEAPAPTGLFAIGLHQ
jgi:hypothetical protein